VRVIVTTAACAVACAVMLTGCAGSGEGVRVEGPSEIPRALARADAEVRATPSAFDGVRVNITEGQTLGVGTPIAVTFARSVPSSERASVERQLKVTALGDGAEGSWNWVEDPALADGQRVDFRPRASWQPGTKVTVKVGTALTRHFTVGRSQIAASAPGH
jgi:hypothetical protein